MVVVAKLWWRLRFDSENGFGDILELLTKSPEGLYCEAGDFHIDPWRPVKRAVITHAHSDHARFGSQKYLATHESVPLIRARLGASTNIRGLDYGEVLTIGSARVSLHPAGHVLGSAQVRVEVAGRVAVVTGDYKRQSDATCKDFEPVPCDLLVTESTFGLPIYRWKEDDVLQREILDWWANNRQQKRPSVLYGYALGKSQRLLSMASGELGPIYIHGALQTPTTIYREAGVVLPKTKLVREAPAGYRFDDALVLAVPSAHGTSWLRRFRNASTAMASGWMQVRGQRRRRSMDRGFVVSDHADWPGLLQTVKETQASEVWTTHGSSDVLARYLAELGLVTRSLETEYGRDEEQDQGFTQAEDEQ